MTPEHIASLVNLFTTGGGDSSVPETASLPFFLSSRLHRLLLYTCFVERICACANMGTHILSMRMYVGVVHPMPTWLVKECLDDLISPNTKKGNKSFSLRVFPKSMKAALLINYWYVHKTIDIENESHFIMTRLVYNERRQLYYEII